MNVVRELANKLNFNGFWVSRQSRKKKSAVRHASIRFPDAGDGTAVPDCPCARATTTPIFQGTHEFPTVAVGLILGESNPMPLQVSGVAVMLARRRGGRPRIAGDAAGRRDMIRLAWLVLSGALLVKEAAAAAGMHRNTLWKRIREFLADGEPDTDKLRELADRM
jgi:hypothetical protein